MTKRKSRDSVMRALLDDWTTLDLIDPKTAAALEWLCAEGYADLTKAWGGVIVRAGPSQMGKLYFEIQARRRLEKWKDRGWSYILGVISGITVTLLFRYIPL